MNSRFVECDRIDCIEEGTEKFEGFNVCERHNRFFRWMLNKFSPPEKAIPMIRLMVKENDGSCDESK